MGATGGKGGAIVVSLNQDRHGFQECGLLRGQVFLGPVHQMFHGGDHMVVLLLGLNGFDDNAIREPGVFLGIDSQRHTYHGRIMGPICSPAQAA